MTDRIGQIPVVYYLYSAMSININVYQNLDSVNHKSHVAFLSAVQTSDLPVVCHGGAFTMCLNSRILT